MLVAVTVLLMQTTTQAAFLTERFMRVLDTAHELQAINPNDVHRVVRIRGYDTAAAADGATFYYDAASAAATNTVSVFKPTSVAGNGRWLRNDATFQAGSTTVPSITFGLDTNTGLANSSADRIDFITGGVNVGNFNSIGELMLGNNTVTSTRTLIINAATDQAKILAFKTGGTNRWQLGSGATTETGVGNTGSPFFLQAYDDAGLAIDSPINITRAAGGTFTTERPFAITSTTESTSTSTGSLRVFGGAGIAKNITGGGSITGLRYIGGVQSLSGAGAVDVINDVTEVTTTGAAQALTLADGVAGQRKVIIHGVDGGSAVLTPTTKTGFSTVTFTGAGESVTLVFLTTRGWTVVGSYLATIAP